ncbi:pimeloyl-ACP methyl ester carboxylesterase [Pseudoduganella flava]|uniref:Alpha/beta fold hydrolase n=1 Tax=Pseudoduganella flava TaxID=871742 RepID=A0A562PZC6_9BURK|nr:alpha/beta hydrolase [Pseudoduganella flava]QGZ38671.1 alpha/beta fold hydrolase [Pseudoduganella flava]TWI49754.1 pimeloyl-ACP methyl ester carboxylesterase [Pseudoduganella flava]
MYRFFHRVLGTLLLAAALAATAAGATTRSYTVTAPDGVPLAVDEAGNPDGPAIVFVHGLLGSRLNWERQFASPVLARYRLIAFDLRGHGLSGKPAGAAAYADGRRWADDLAAVLATAKATKPVLVGWSLGAAVITNYLAAYGDAGIGGAVYVGGVIELKPEQITAHPALYRDLASADLKTHLDAERAFLGLCFATPPQPDVLQRLLANAAMASWEMTAAVPSMTIDAAAGLGRLGKPLLLVYGERDALVQPQPSIARARALQPRAVTALYPGAGHAPFIEAPERFERDLASFVDRAAGAGVRPAAAGR